MSDIEYKIVKRKRFTGGVSLRIKDGSVTVTAPFWVTTSAIEQFIQSKIDWIKNTITKQLSTVQPKKLYEAGENHLLFGQEKKLQIVFSDSPTRTTISLEQEALLARVYSGFDTQKQKLEIETSLLRFYLEQGIEYITEKANYYSDLLGVSYSKIDIKKVSSIWGSCSAKNVLSFNRKLVMAPKEIIDYVIIHEVCHLRERNHSSRFWALVRNFDKNYKQNRHWLSKNHHFLTI